MKLEDIPLQELLLKEIKSLSVDIGLIEDVPEVAAQLLHVPELQLDRVRNSLVISRSILEFQNFFHHRL